LGNGRARLPFRALVGNARAREDAARDRRSDQRRSEPGDLDAGDARDFRARGCGAGADARCAVRRDHPAGDRGVEEGREGRGHQGGMTTLRQRDYAPGARGPLSGVRVLDLSRLVAGNTLTGLLADFGADVVKVESPEGDTLRAWRTAGVQANWKLYARNKRSLALDLRKPEALELVLALVEKAAVFVESFRPDTLEKIGLAPRTLLARNPRLVIVRISGWGQDGPYRRRPGFGTLVEGISGFAAMNGFADREPVLPPMYMADSYA